MLFDSKLAIPLDDIRHRVEEAGKANRANYAVAAADEIDSEPLLTALRAAKGWGQVAETLQQCRTPLIRQEANSVNDNPLIDPVSDRAGIPNFAGRTSRGPWTA